MSNSPEIALYFAEFAFGLLYAILVHWLASNKYLEGNTALSVIIGDAITLLIAYAFIRDAMPMRVIFIAFACSGLPMTLSYWYRHEQRRSHKPRELGNRARRIRDEAEMDLQLIAKKMADGENPATLVHAIHLVRGSLKGM